MWTSVNRVLLFWTAFILTRPLAAAVGDFLDKPLDHGGLAFSHPIASAVLGAAILLLILLLPQRAGPETTHALPGCRGPVDIPWRISGRSTKPCGVATTGLL